MTTVTDAPAHDETLVQLANGLSCELPADSPLAKLLRSQRTWVGPDAKQRLKLLRNAKSVAIVGASPNPARSSYFVGTYLQQSSDYRVYFVNPNADTILGQPAYKSLADLPEVPDIVDVFRRAEVTPEIAREAGVDFVHFSGMTEKKEFPTANGSGVAVFDYDGDGLLDLYFATATLFPVGSVQKGPNRLYKNLGGNKFRDVTESAGLGFHGYCHGIVVGDVVRIEVTDEIENNIAVFARTFLPQLAVVKERVARLFGLGGEIVDYLKPGSWVGGDRDGNPNVSPQTLDYAMHRQSETVLDHYLAEVHALGAELSLSDSLVSISRELAALGAAPENTSVQQMDEPYRRALVTCYARLAATRKALLGQGPARPARFEAARYGAPEEFAADLDVIARSLNENGDADLGEGRLLHLRESVAAFGFHLAVMDVRQNSDVHERAVAELLNVAGAENEYLALPEQKRTALLERELSHARPLRSPYAAYSALTARELAIADHVAALKRDFGQGAVAQYVISKASSVSDLLEVAVLMKEAGLFVPGERAQLRIVPLFETIDDLRRSADVMGEFFALPLARAMLAE